MPDVEGQWDFYPNLTLKIKHTLVHVNQSIIQYHTSRHHVVVVLT